jgi:hypothetical protein
MDTLIGLLLMVGLPGYFVLQILFPLRYDGGWRVAALLPLIVMLPAIAHAVFALSQESNLWPLVVILIAPVLFLYLCAVGAARFVMRGSPI